MLNIEKVGSQFLPILKKEQQIFDFMYNRLTDDQKDAYLQNVKVGELANLDLTTKEFRNLYQI
jgi:hypothetical protein